jgi:hypothetical protein
MLLGLVNSSKAFLRIREFNFARQKPDNLGLKRGSQPRARASLRRERGDDFFEARIASEGVPVR